MNGDRPSPAADLVWSLAWIAGGAALFAGGYGMDRLAAQHINPYTAPGLVPAALGQVRKGGSVVCAGIHMSDIPTFPYELLWGERVLRSVANLTRADGEEFLALAPTVPVHTAVETFPLEAANEALDRLRRGELRGAAVLIP